MQFVAPGPGRIGYVDVLMDAIPASRADIARHLGITPRTLATYAARGVAPRAVEVALFVESNYGRNLIHTTAHNDARLQAAIAECLRCEVATLQVRIARLEALGDFGSANAPTARPAPALASISAAAPLSTPGQATPR